MFTLSHLHLVMAPCELGVELSLEATLQLPPARHPGLHMGLAGRSYSTEPGPCTPHGSLLPDLETDTRAHKAHVLLLPRSLPQCRLSCQFLLTAKFKYSSSLSPHKCGTAGKNLTKTSKCLVELTRKKSLDVKLRRKRSHRGITGQQRGCNAHSWTAKDRPQGAGTAFPT